MDENSLDWRVVSPKEHRGKSVIQAFTQIKWDDRSRSRYEEVVNRGQHVARCDMNGRHYQVSDWIVGWSR